LFWGGIGAFPLKWPEIACSHGEFRRDHAPPFLLIFHLSNAARDEAMAPRLPSMENTVRHDPEWIKKAPR
jgi:hypothetical protein